MEAKTNQGRKIVFRLKVTTKYRSGWKSRRKTEQNKKTLYQNSSLMKLQKQGLRENSE
jgi:hypothetical protein